MFPEKGSNDSMADPVALTSLSPAQRTELVYKTYDYRHDRLMLATAGLDRVRWRERTKQSRMKTGYVVERVLSEQYNGMAIEVRRYLLCLDSLGKKQRVWVGVDRAQVFGTKREVDRNRALMGDDGTKVIPFSQMIIEADLLNSLPASV